MNTPFVFNDAAWARIRHAVLNPRDATSATVMHNAKGAMTQWLQQPDAAIATIGAQRMHAMHTATLGDFPAQALDNWPTLRNMPTYDTAYQEIFHIRDYTYTKKTGFNLNVTKTGLSFSLTVPGEAAKIYTASGEQMYVKFDRYTGGLGWDLTELEDNEFYDLEDQSTDFRNKAAQDRAQAHYDLIDEVGAGGDVGWGGVSTDDAALRDAKTINTAVLQIINAMTGTSTVIGLGTEFIVLAPYSLHSRIKHALTYNYQDSGGSEKAVSYRVTPRYSTMLSATDVYYVILPKNKLVGGNRQNLRVDTQSDVISNSQVWVGSMRHAAAIGDTNQVVRCAVA